MRGGGVAGRFDFGSFLKFKMADVGIAAISYGATLPHLALRPRARDDRPIRKRRDLETCSVIARVGLCAPDTPCSKSEAFHPSLRSISNVLRLSVIRKKVAKVEEEGWIS